MFDVFRETQTSKPWWAWAIVLLAASAGLWAFVQQILLGKPFGDKPGPDWLVWVIVVVTALVIPIVFKSLRLEVEVGTRSIDWRFRPFRSGTIPLDQIRSAEVCRYRPFRDYLGWGLRWTPWAGSVVSMRGDRGVRIVLENGKRILIGSRRAAELADAIRGQPH